MIGMVISIPSLRFLYKPNAEMIMKYCLASQKVVKGVAHSFSHDDHRHKSVAHYPQQPDCGTKDSNDPVLKRVDLLNRVGVSRTIHCENQNLVD